MGTLANTICYDKINLQGEKYMFLGIITFGAPHICNQVSCLNCIKPLMFKEIHIVLKWFKNKFTFNWAGGIAFIYIP